MFGFFKRFTYPERTFPTYDAAVGGQIVVLELSRFSLLPKREMSCMGFRRMRVQPEAWNCDCAYREGRKGFLGLERRQGISWCISGTPHTSRQQPHSKQPTACNPYLRRIEGHARTTSRQSDGCCALDVRGSQERRKREDQGSVKKKGKADIILKVQDI